MKDSVQLLFAGVMLAVVAWVLWHYGSCDAFGTISTIALIAAIADNVRLRRAMRMKHRE